jgi:uncharacterized membrane protein YeaQ/YmgE (transglycosylase-associated protein family)
MGIITWIIIGLVVSILTLLIEPYIIRSHIPITIILGVIGAVIGGAIASFLGFDSVKGMRFMIIVMSIAGSVFVLTWDRGIEQA